MPYEVCYRALLSTPAVEGLKDFFPPSTVETASPMSILVFARDGATEIGLRARDRDENRTRACSMDLLPQLRPRSPP